MNPTRVLFFGSDRRVDFVQQSAAGAGLIVERAPTPAELISSLQSRAYSIVVLEHSLLELEPCFILD